MSQLPQSPANESFAAPMRSSALTSALTPARTSGLTLITAIQAIHATATRIAHTGPPLDMVTQLCAVVAHVDLDVAQFSARESLRSLFRAGPSILPVPHLQQPAA